MRPIWTAKSHFMRFVALGRRSSQLKSSASMWESLNSTAAFFVAMMMSRGLVELHANAVIARKGAGILMGDSSYSASLTLAVVALVGASLAVSPSAGAAYFSRLACRRVEEHLPCCVVPSVSLSFSLV
jgi:hypothetical protein